MIIKVTKTAGFTNRVLAHDGPTGLLVVDLDGNQEVVDHPFVRQLISNGTVKEVKGGKPTEQSNPEIEAEAELSRAREEAKVAADAESMAIKDAEDREKADAKAKAK